MSTCATFMCFTQLHRLDKARAKGLFISHIHAGMINQLPVARSVRNKVFISAKDCLMPSNSKRWRTPVAPCVLRSPCIRVNEIRSLLLSLPKKMALRAIAMEIYYEKARSSHFE